MSKTIFISYSHMDEKWKDRLVTHLRVFQLEFQVDVWDDRLIGAGEDWYAKIQEAIERSDLAILLVSTDFLASSFIRREEVPQLLHRKAGEGLHILPVLVHPCNWESVKWLSALQIRPTDARPVSAGHGYEREQALKDIAQEAVAILQGERRPHPLEPLSAGLQPESLVDGLSPPAGKGRPAEYICYLSTGRLASLFEQVDYETLADPRLLHREKSLLPLGASSGLPETERSRRAAVSQLLVVLNYLEKTSRIGDLAAIARAGGRLDCDWYTVEASFQSDAWDQAAEAVYLTGRIGDYSLRLSCKKDNFTGLDKEGKIYIPNSVQRFLFYGEAELLLRGLVRLAAVNRLEKVLLGSALYLVLSSDLGSL